EDLYGALAVRAFFLAALNLSGRVIDDIDINWCYGRLDAEIAISSACQRNDRLWPCFAHKSASAAISKCGGGINNSAFSELLKSLVECKAMLCDDRTRG